MAAILKEKPGPKLCHFAFQLRRRNFKPTIYANNTWKLLKQRAFDRDQRENCCEANSRASWRTKPVTTRSIDLLLTPVKRLKKRFKNACKKVAVDPFWILIVLTMISLPIPYPFVSFITARSNIYFHHLCTNFYSNLFIQLYWNQIFFGNFIFILFLEFRKSCFLFN